MAISISVLKSGENVMERIYWTAKQLHESMIKTETPKNRLYKLMKEVAQEGGCNGLCFWFEEFFDDQVKHRLIEDLIADGYLVKTVLDEDSGKELNAIEIHW